MSSSTPASTYQPADHAARRAALDPSRSFAVSAPAGSGKTGLLTQRVLKLLARCDYPEEVLGITFTRKAAQEMHHRISKALQDASADTPVNSEHEQLTRELALAVLEQDREQGWQLLRSPGRLRIQTIDAFCQSLVRQLPVAAGTSAYLETRENAQGLYRAAVQALFREMRNEGPLADAMATLLRHMDNNVGKVESLLAELLNKRSQWLAPLFRAGAGRHYFEESLHTIVRESLEAALERLCHCLDQLQELLHFSVDNRLRQDLTFSFGLEDIDLAQLDQNPELALSLWQAVVDMCLTKEDTWRKKLDKTVGFPPKNASKNPFEQKLYANKKQQLTSLLQEFSGDPALLILFRDIRCLPNIGVEQNQWALLESLTVLLPSLAAIFHLHCRTVGEADFNEVAIAASRALGDEDAPTEVALKLDYQIKHILVDEFQDTSMPQLELLQKLTAGWQPGDGRSLFIVGDAMQSCYGFRDANVGIFIRSREQGIGTVPLEPLNLTVNFRSSAALVEWVNNSFSAILPPGNDVNRGAVCYSPAEPCQRTDEADSLIRARAFVGGDGRQQSRYLVELVREELAANAGSSIAILARSRTHLQDILLELRLAGIDWQARDIDVLRDRMAVVDLLSLTRALLDISDRIAWLSLLRAPWCGLDMEDLHTLANQNIEQNLPRGGERYPLLWGQILHCEALALSPQGLALVQRLRSVLQPALAHKGRKPLRQWIEGIWLALGGPAAVANPAESHSPEHFFGLLEQHGRGGEIADWEEFDSALASLYDKSDQQARLQVMTIHKSKGLEFDTVIIPKLDKGTRGDDSPLLLWQEYTDREGQSHLLISPLGAVGDKADRLYAYLKRERGIRQDYEAARLLYVACTRAISKLYLLMDVQRDEHRNGEQSGEIKPPARGTLANHLWERIKDELEYIEPAAEDATESPHQAVLANILRLPPDWRSPPWPRDETLARHRPPSSFAAGENLPDAAALHNRVQRYLGTVLHRALQAVVEDGLDEWPESRVSQQQVLWSRQLRQLGLSASEANPGAARIAEALARALADRTGRWLLDNSHAGGFCELALTDASAGYREAVIDRTFIAEGCRWVVDYKSAEPGPEGEAEFLRRQAAEYRPQLRRYAELMRALDRRRGDSLPVRTALYFPLLQRWHEVELNAAPDQLTLLD